MNGYVVCLTICVGFATALERPSFVPYAGHHALRQPVKVGKNKFSQHYDWKHPETGQPVKLLYDIELSDQEFVFLDKEMTVVAVECTSNSLKMMTQSSVDAHELAQRLRGSPFITGGREWRCKDHGKRGRVESFPPNALKIMNIFTFEGVVEAIQKTKVILRKGLGQIVSVVNNVVTTQTREASYGEVFKHSDVISTVYICLRSLTVYSHHIAAGGSVDILIRRQDN
jgi:hypothetical protein